MIYKKTKTAEPAIEHVSSVINERLGAGKKVLWLLSGGSSIDWELEVAKKINDADLKNLTVSLADERFGPVGHKDSNWYQLESRGFDLPGAKLQPVLIDKDLPSTVQLFDKFLTKAYQDADYVLVVAGFGPDGHVVGIKPKSPAVFSTQMATGYRGEDFKRISITAKALLAADETVTYATGEAKHPVIDQLNQDIALAIMPAQALKSIKIATIYNDYKGEPA